MQTRRGPFTLGAAAVALVLAIGLTACNPPKGQATIELVGIDNGSTTGPEVTCTTTGGTRERAWYGTIGGSTAAVRMTIDSKGQTVSLHTNKGFTSYHAGLKSGLITADKWGTWHTDVDMINNPNTTDRQHLTAAMTCP